MTKKIRERHMMLLKDNTENGKDFYNEFVLNQTQNNLFMPSQNNSNNNLTNNRGGFFQAGNRDSVQKQQTNNMSFDFSKK